MFSIRSVHRARTQPACNPRPALMPLVAELCAACECPPPVMGDRVVAALHQAPPISLLMTPEQCEASAHCYTRRVIYSDPAGRFTILALVWGPGQFSPVHAHQTWCAYAVCDDALTETEYVLEAGRAVPVSTAMRHRGYCCCGQAGLDEIHRLGNAGARPAISLHVYGVDSARIATHVNRIVDVA